MFGFRTLFSFNVSSIYLAKYPEGVYVRTEENRNVSDNIKDMSDSEFQELVDQLGDEVFMYEKLKELTIITTVPQDNIDMSHFTKFPARLTTLYLTTLNVDLSSLTHISTLKLMYLGIWEKLPKSIKQLEVTEVLYLINDVNNFMRYLRSNNIDVILNKIVDLEVVRKKMPIILCNKNYSEREVLSYIDSYIDPNIFMRILSKY
jgi:hypothetical protein